MKKLLQNKDLKILLIRSGVFFGIIFAFYLFVFLYFRHTAFFAQYLRIDSKYYFDFLTGLRKSDFLNSVLFTIVIFIIWNRNKILKIKSQHQDIKQTIVFGIAAILTQVGHYFFKYLIKSGAINGNPLMLTLIKYSFNISFFALLALAVFNLRFIKEQLGKYKRQIPFFIGLLAVYFFLIQAFQTIWRVLGNFVASAIYFILNLTFSDAYINLSAVRAPRIGVGNFIVGISEECSGIDSMLLFLSLYVVLFALDWNKMNRKRMLLLLIPGIIGTVLYNLFRVYLIMIVGIFYSPEFAVDVFHTNVGWVLFLLFFIVFWHFGSKWVYKKS